MSEIEELAAAEADEWADSGLFQPGKALLRHNLDTSQLRRLAQEHPTEAVREQARELLKRRGLDVLC